MFNSLTLLLLILSNINYERVFVKGHKLVYKKDFSEYCRRRVVPSVFLGRQVVEANSQILHFSKLELPYSCFISVRSESGSNIILVIEFSSHESLTSSCANDADQLLVYEMGETFGGYWGPLTDGFIYQDAKNEIKYYTIKTTPSLDIEDSSIENDDFVETATSTESITVPLTNNLPSEVVDYIEKEVPIVNVSGFLIPGVQQRPVVDVDSVFDIVYEVSPGSEISYDSTMLPIVQFSGMNNFNARRNENISRYRIDYNTDSFPMDINLIYPKILTSKKRKLYRKYKYNTNKLLNFKGNERIFKSMQTLSYLHKFTKRQQSTTTSRLNHVTRRVFTLNSKSSPVYFKTENANSWDLFDTLLKSLNKTTNDESPTSEYTPQVLRNLSEMKHNLNVYLSPNVSTSKEKSEAISTRDYVIRTPTTINFSNYQNLYSESDVLLSEATTATLILLNNSQATGSVLSVNFTDSYGTGNTETENLHTICNNLTIQNNSNIRVSGSEFKSLYSNNTDDNILIKNAHNYPALTILNYTKPLRGSLVGRESWENVVQIAPVMADVLKAANSNKNDTMKSNIKGHNRARRKKKHINSISIDIARPRKMIMKRKMGTTVTGSYNIADMQEFAQLVELQDDEIHGRVALRYLRRYVGPVLFNVCNYEEALARHVYLFNSSRIVLAISNFTIDKMALVATPAHTLMTNDERCSSTQFECQVSGVRVCIDSLTACDGVPNCGSYDIYDEDRLMCGAAIGLQHNVCLAAFTFLAVLLTLLYTIHYWLKRCVPKVSEAFFIYTEGFDNMLYLDTIMRNPTEDDDSSKPVYQSNIFQDDLLCSVVREESKKTRVLKSIKKILACSCFRYKENKSDKLPKDDFYSSLAEPKRIYSFTELEIRKMLCNNLIETGVQTEDSLELTRLNKNSNERHVADEKCDKSQKYNIANSLLGLNNSSLNILDVKKQQKKLDELGVMKFVNDSRSSSYTLRSNATLKIKTRDRSSITPEEKEIHSHVYEHQGRNIPASSSGGIKLTSSDVHEEKVSSAQIKHLRFKESATVIPADHYYEDESIENENKSGQRRSVILGMGRAWNTSDLDAIEEVQPQGSSSNRDYIRFWSKSKRSKKPHS